MFQWLWTETSMNVRPQANLPNLLGELVLFSRWTVKRTDLPLQFFFCFLPSDQNISCCWVWGGRLTAGQCAGSQQRCLLTELCNWPVVILGKLDCGFLPCLSHHPFSPLPFLFFLFRQWAVWEKEMPLKMYIQHLSQWESYHKTRNQSEKSVNRTRFFSS